MVAKIKAMIDLFLCIMFLVHSCSVDSCVISTDDGSGDPDAHEDVVQHPAVGPLLVPGVVSEEDEVHQGGHDEGEEGAA